MSPPINPAKQIEKSVTRDTETDKPSSPSILTMSTVCETENYPSSPGISKIISTDCLDNETFDTQSTNKRTTAANGLDDINTEELQNLEDNIPKRKRQKRNDKNNWEKNKSKELREKGKKYKGKKRKEMCGFIIKTFNEKR